MSHERRCCAKVMPRIVRSQSMAREARFAAAMGDRDQADLGVELDVDDRVWKARQDEPSDVEVFRCIARERPISFGSNRMDMGYTQFEVTLDKFRSVDLGRDLGVQSHVPLVNRSHCEETFKRIEELLGRRLTPEAFIPCRRSTMSVRRCSKN
jgi:hypothetical protein